MNRRQALLGQLADLQRFYQRSCKQVCQARLGECEGGTDQADALADERVELKDAVMQLLPDVISLLELEEQPRD